jgi:hypothetical protein
MADITMCLNRDCRLKNDCWRHAAPPSRWQSYSKFEADSDENKCTHFWPAKEMYRRAPSRTPDKKPNHSGKG